MSDLVVRMSGQSCGLLSQSKTGNLTFSYFESYPPDFTPISLAMPVGATSYSKAKVLPFLEGLLPDNQSALAAIGRNFGVSPNNPFALLSHIGADVAGALTFHHSDLIPDRTPSQKLTASAVRQLLENRISGYSSGIPIGELGWFSLAGAQPKLALLRGVDGQWSLPGTDTPSSHILKPVPQAFPDLDLLELVTMRVASKLGLEVANTSVEDISGLSVLISERFDRRQVGDKTERVHQEDFCQALSRTPKRKYQKHEGGPGVKAIGGLIKSLPQNSRKQIASAFFRALVFNVLVRAPDAHAKNYSLLLEGTAVRLAPLYDLISGVAFTSDLDSAMSIGGQYRFSSITKTDLVQEGIGLGADSPDLIIAEILAGFTKALQKAVLSLEKELPQESFQKVELIAKTLGDHAAKPWGN